ncbi:MAG: hypothetical protein H7Z75_18110 [Ferruginibacter sp.]|nr:hypothetical protein [Cytophagales bacterium]
MQILTRQEAKTIYFMLVTGVAIIDNEKMHCSGEIEILSVNEKQVYATWKMFAGDSAIASVSRNYYVPSNTTSESEILKLVIENIAKYRMGRKRTFSDVVVVA